MGRIIVLIACIATGGCASTTFYSKGVKVAHIQADLDAVTFRSHADGSIEFQAARMNHSLPTRAGGSVIGTATTGATSIVTALAAKGIIK